MIGILFLGILSIPVAFAPKPVSDPSYLVEVYTLEPHPKWTPSIAKGYCECDDVPVRVIVSYKNTGPQTINFYIGAEYYDDGAGAFGIDYLKDFSISGDYVGIPSMTWDDNPTNAPPATPFTFPYSAGTGTGEVIDLTGDRGTTIRFIISVDIAETGSTAKSFTINFFAHQALTEFSGLVITKKGAYFWGAANIQVSKDPGEIGEKTVNVEKCDEEPTITTTETSSETTSTETTTETSSETTSTETTTETTSEITSTVTTSTVTTTIVELDFGDAPDPLLTTSGKYPTLLANDGARHIIGNLWLGDAIDAETDGQPTSPADGDDNNPAIGPNDEDGVSFLGAGHPGGPYQKPYLAGKNGAVQIKVSGTFTTAYIFGWIDWNQDGDWGDAGEDLFGGGYLVTTTGLHTIDFIVPIDAKPGNTYGRFRLIEGSVILGPTGSADSGEVEDYLVDPETNFPSEKPLDPGPGQPVRATVGGYMLPVNKLAILIPYLIVIGLFGAITIAIGYRKKRQN